MTLSWDADIRARGEFIRNILPSTFAEKEWLIAVVETERCFVPHMRLQSMFNFLLMGHSRFEAPSRIYIQPNPLVYILSCQGYETQGVTCRFCFIISAIMIIVLSGCRSHANCRRSSFVRIHASWNKGSIDRFILRSKAIIETRITNEISSPCAKC